MKPMKPTPLHRPATLALLLGAAWLAAAPGVQAQIKRWVDENGVVHYSDTAPQARPAAPVTIIDPAAPQSPADHAAATQRLQQYRDQLATTPQPPPSGASAPAAPARPTGNSCADQWARYNAAYACMDPYRMTHGGIRPEAFEKCPVVAEPGCPPPGRP